MPISCGSVAEWSKALVLGTSLSGGVGSNPTAAMVLPLLLIGSWMYVVFPDLRCLMINNSLFNNILVIGSKRVHSVNVTKIYVEPIL